MVVAGVAAHLHRPRGVRGRVEPAAQGDLRLDERPLISCKPSAMGSATVGSQADTLMIRQRERWIAMGKDNEKDESNKDESNKDDGKHNIGDDFDLSEYDDR